MKSIKISDLSKSKSKILSEAHEEALKGSFTGVRHRMSCVAFKNGTIISKGRNHLRTKLGNNIMPSFHAEVDTINRIKKKESSRKIDVLITRIDWNGCYANAMPCMHCTSIMLCKGIRRVYYTLSNDLIIVAKVKDLINNTYLTYSQQNHLQNKRCKLSLTQLITN